MRVLTLIALFSSLAIATSAQSDKTLLKDELAVLRKSILSSFSESTKSKANFIDRESGDIRKNAIRLESKITGFSGCSLSFSDMVSNPGENYESDRKVSIPLKHVDLESTFATFDRGVLLLEFSTRSPKIRVTGFTSSTSQSARIYVTSHFSIRLAFTGNQNEFTRDFVRAIQICTLL